MRTGLQKCRTHRTLCTAVFDSILKKQFYLCATWSISRQRVKSADESAFGTQNRRTAAYRSLPCRTEPYTDGSFFSPEINPCEIHENFHCKPNALHHQVIYRSVNPLLRTAAYPAVLYVLMPNDEADRVLLRTGHHGQKSERICSTADFSPTSTLASPIRKPIIRNYGGKTK